MHGTEASDNNYQGDAPQPTTWATSETGSPEDESKRFRLGRGNWSTWQASGLSLDVIRGAAADWAHALEGVDKPWLCWNVDEEWNLVQQRLVQMVGWTPVIGFDPRVGPPRRTVDGAVVVDFNRTFGFPVLFPHFVLEFVFLFAKRLAFWHSDLLLRPEKMRRLADRFAALPDGAMAAVGQRFSFSDLRRPGEKRYWELIGCTTSGASADQFAKGCGWWMNFAAHPNCPDETERSRRKRCYWDYGAGVRYWHEHYRGPTRLVRERYVAEGHCTRIKNPDYKPQSPENEKRNLAADIRYNYDLAAVCKRLGIGELADDI